MSQQTENQLAAVVQPLIDSEAGERMELVRMKMLLDQKEMAELLGVTQQQLSRLERGQVKCSGITLARFKAVFKRSFSFILFGQGEGIDRREVTARYWDTRLRIKRKYGPRKPFSRDAQALRTLAKQSEGSG